MSKRKYFSPKQIDLTKSYYFKINPRYSGMKYTFYLRSRGGNKNHDN